MHNTREFCSNRHFETKQNSKKKKASMYNVCYLQCISRTCIAIWGVEFRDSWSTLQLTTAPSSLRSARKSSVLLTVNVLRTASSSFKYLTSVRKNEQLVAFQKFFGEKSSPALVKFSIAVVAFFISALVSLI